MRVSTLATSALAILAGADSAMAGPRAARRDVSASVRNRPRSTPPRIREQQTGPDKTARRGIRHQAHYRGGARHHRIGGPIGLGRRHGGPDCSGAVDTMGPPATGPVADGMADL